MYHKETELSRESRTRRKYCKILYLTANKRWPCTKTSFFSPITLAGNGPFTIFEEKAIQEKFRNKYVRQLSGKGKCNMTHSMQTRMRKYLQYWKLFGTLWDISYTVFLGEVDSYISLSYYLTIIGALFVICGVTMVDGSVIRRPKKRLITLTETSIILYITKTEFNNCSIIHFAERMKPGTGRNIILDSSWYFTESNGQNICWTN